MLRINYRYREFINNYLREIYRLRFHEIQIVDIKRIIFIGKTVNRDGVIRSKFVITQFLQYALSNKNVLLGFYDIREIFKSIKITLSKRNLRNEIYFYNHIS